MTLAASHFAQDVRGVHLISEITQGWQLALSHVLGWVHDVILGSGVVEEDGTLNELVTFVDTVSLGGLGVCAVGLSLNLLHSSRLLVGNVNIRRSFEIKALAVELRILLVDGIRYFVHVIKVVHRLLFHLVVVIFVEVFLQILTWQHALCISS